VAAVRRVRQYFKVQMAKRSERHPFKVMSKRWGEHSFAGREKNRRLGKNRERWLNTSLPFVPLACLARLLKRLGTGS